MADFIEISKDGITIYRWNAEKRNKYKIKKEPGKVSVSPKKPEAGLIFFTSPTMEEAEKFFYDAEQCDMTWPHLRDRCVVRQGTTLTDLFKIINEDEMLQFFVERLWPHFDAELQPNPVIVKRKVVIEKTDFSICREINNGGNFGFPSVPNMPIQLDESVGIYRDGNLIGTATMVWSLLEILQTLFGDYDTKRSLVLTKDGLFEGGQSIATEPEIFSSLLFNCSLAEDVTLGDIFKFVKQHELLKQFIATYSWCREIDEFHKDAEQPKPQDGFIITGLAISSCAQIDEYFDLSVDFDGVGPLSETTRSSMLEIAPNEELPTMERYGVGFCHAGEISNLPLVLDPLLTIQSKDSTIMCARKYSLLEILDAIYWEISFYGGPSDAQKVKEKLVGIKKGMDDGTIETTPIDQLENEKPGE